MPSDDTNQQEPRTCLTEKEIPNAPLLLHDIDTSDKKRLSLILDEFIRGFRFVQQYNRSISFFGSSRTEAGEKDYERARALAARAVSECDFSVVTGGGPGIMEAANRGAYDVDGDSLGLTIELPKEQATNDYVKKSVDFHYFFVRKVMLAFSAEAYVFFPGGFGTMDELFELLVLIQTNKVKPVPIFLVDHGHWRVFDDYVKENLLEKGMIDEEDMNIYTVTDDEEYIIETLRNVPVEEGVPYDYTHDAGIDYTHEENNNDT